MSKRSLLDLIRSLDGSLVEYDTKMDILGARGDAAKASLRVACMERDKLKIKEHRDALVKTYADGVDLMIETHAKMKDASKNSLQDAVDKGAEELNPKE